MDRQIGPLSVDEFHKAQVVLIHLVQQQEFSEELYLLRARKPVPKSSALYKLDPHLGEDRSLRVGGRLQWSGLSFEERHPIILPKSNLAVGGPISPQASEAYGGRYNDHGREKHILDYWPEKVGY